MNKDQREIQRKLRILRYAEELGHVAKADLSGAGRSRILAGQYIAPHSATLKIAQKSFALR